MQTIQTIIDKLWLHAICAKNLVDFGQWLWLNW